MSPEDAIACQEALALLRRVDLILATHWTPEQLDAVDPYELDAIETVTSMRAGLKAENDYMHQAQQQQTG
jgi:hypothetical protein